MGRAGEVNISRAIRIDIITITYVIFCQSRTTSPRYFCLVKIKTRKSRGRFRNRFLRFQTRLGGRLKSPGFSYDFYCKVQNSSLDTLILRHVVLNRSSRKPSYCCFKVSSQTDLGGERYKSRWYANDITGTDYIIITSVICHVMVIITFCEKKNLIKRPREICSTSPGPAPLASSMRVYIATTNLLKLFTRIIHAIETRSSRRNSSVFFCDALNSEKQKQ